MRYTGDLYAKFPSKLKGFLFSISDEDGSHQTGSPLEEVIWQNLQWKVAG